MEDCIRKSLFDLIKNPEAPIEVHKIKGLKRHPKEVKLIGKVLF